MILRRSIAALVLALGLAVLGAGPASAAPARPAQDPTTTVVGDPAATSEPEPAQPASSGPVLVVGVLAMTVVAVGFGIWLRRREG